MDFTSYVTEQALVLIPVLYLIGVLLKATPNIPDWLIPYILGGLGILGAIFLLGFNVQSVIQGILAAGASVYVNQAIKQAKKKDNDTSE